MVLPALVSGWQQSSRWIGWTVRQRSSGHQGRRLAWVGVLAERPSSWFAQSASCCQMAVRDYHHSPVAVGMLTHTSPTVTTSRLFALPDGTRLTRRTLIFLLRQREFDTMQATRCLGFGQKSGVYKTFDEPLSYVRLGGWKGVLIDLTVHSAPNCDCTHSSVRLLVSSTATVLSVSDRRSDTYIHTYQNIVGTKLIPNQPKCVYTW